MDQFPQTAAPSVPLILLTYIVGSIASSGTFVIILGSFQYFSYRKFYKRLMKIKDDLEKEYGQQKVAEKLIQEAQNDGTKN